MSAPGRRCAARLSLWVPALAALAALAAAKGGGGGGGGGCFTADTEVTLADGSRRPLRDIQSGDVVASWDEDARRTANSTVRAVLTYHRPLEDIVEVSLASGSTLQATEDHPFWSRGPLGLASVNPEGTLRLYGLHAELMAAGLELEDEQQAPVPVQGLRRLIGAPLEARRSLRSAIDNSSADVLGEVIPVLTLCLEPHHWYYVRGVRVHNKGCFAPWTPVLLENGKEAPIQSVRAGDRVVSWDDVENHVSIATVTALEVFPSGELWQLTFNSSTSSAAASSISLVLTPDHPVYSVRAGGPVSASPEETAELYGLEVGMMEIREQLQTSSGGTVEAEVSEWTGDVPATVMTLKLDRHHWFYAHGVRVHNKGGGYHGGFYGGGGGGSVLATIVTLSVLGSVFSCCCCCFCFYWAYEWLTVKRPWRRRLAEMADKRKQAAGARGPLPEVLRLWGDFRETGQSGKCEYTWHIQPDGTLEGSGFDVDGNASVDGKVCWGDDGRGEVFWLESRPGISVETHGTVEPDPSQPGAFKVEAEYWSTDCKTSGHVTLQSGLEIQADVTSCDQIVAEFPDTQEDCFGADTTDHVSPATAAPPGYRPGALSAAALLLPAPPTASPASPVQPTQPVLVPPATSPRSASPRVAPALKPGFQSAQWGEASLARAASLAPEVD